MKVRLRYMSNYQYYEYQPGGDDGSNNNQDNGYNPYSNQYNGPVNNQPKKEKKPHKKAKFFGKVVAAALIFGLVAGPVTYGTNRLTSHFAGGDSTATEETNNNSSSSGEISSTATSATASSDDVSSIASETLPSIVQVTNMSLEKVQSWFGTSSTIPTKSLGSGVIFKQDDNYLYIATNNHVVSNSNSLSVTFNDNKSVTGEVVGTDVQSDLAVIKVKLSSLKDSTKKAIKVASLGSSASLKVGQQAIVIGNALGYGQSVTTGVISALNREVSIQNEDNGKTYTQEMIQTSAAVNSGNSGGALLNSKGQVVGIVSAKYSSSGSSQNASVEGMGFAIPIDNAKTIIDQLMSTGKVTNRPGSKNSDSDGSSSTTTSEQGFLGIQGADISSEMASSYSMPQGVYVTKVVSGSPAEKAGIKKGDVITGVDGTTISSMSSLREYISGKKKGDKVKVAVATVENDYKSKNVEVTLTARPEDDSDSGSDNDEDSDNSQDNSGSDDDGSNSFGNGGLYDWSQIFGN
ncbi:MAG: trypsin-like peptidase domain-containing protein [Lachnospiraceae bacterium]|nr:trypsin-like peptidase domain-containing protein [Lachnospiraceae bacterium]